MAAAVIAVSALGPPVAAQDPGDGVAADSPSTSPGPPDVVEREDVATEVARVVGREGSMPPARARFELHVGQRLLAQGLDARAAEAFHRVVAAAPRHPGGWYLLSRALASGARSAEALEAAETAVERLEAVPPAARASFDHAMFYENLGVARSTVGDLAGAEEPLRQAVALRPGDGTLHARLGAVLLRRGVNAEAARELALATELRPDMGRAWRALGQALVRLEQPEPALEALAHAAQLAPGDPDVAFQVAAARRLQGDEGALEEALAEFERLRATREREMGRHEEIDGRLRDVLRLLADDDCATAEPLLRELLAEPEVIAGGHQATRVLGDLARCRDQAGDVDEARSLLTRALTRKPDSFLLHFELGTLLAQQGQAVGAVPHLLAAARANPFDYAVHVNLGLCFGLLGRLNEALGELRRAVAIQPEETRARQLLLDLEWAVGNRVQAEALLHLGGVDAPAGMPGAPEAGQPSRTAEDWAP